MKNDPMFILEKLPNSRVLGSFEKSYVGEKLTSSSRGFPQLQSLKLEGLDNYLKELIIEKESSWVVSTEKS